MEGRKIIIEPERETPVVGEFDVLVGGGGPSGVSAALSAARKGAKVILLEQYGFLGGMATAGGVHMFHVTRTVKGIYKEVLEYLKKLGATDPILPFSEMIKYFFTSGRIKNLRKELVSLFRDGTFTDMVFKKRGTALQFHPDILKYVLSDLLLKEGIILRFHTFISDVVMEKNKIKALIVESKSGREAIMADVFIDATGDADIAALAGVPYTKGEDSDKNLQPMSLLFNLQRIGKNVKPILPPGCVQYRKDTDLPHEKIIITTTRGGRILVNLSRIGGDATNVEDLTNAEIEGMKQVLSIAHYLQTHGFEKCALISVAPQLGVRETRQIIGEYVLSEKDLLSGKTFNDVIAVGDYVIDIHHSEGRGFTQRTIPRYYIPYRCLVPKKVENLLVVGRCISATHIAMSSLRIMPICMAIGQAGGTAAALAVEKNQSPRTVDVKRLQDELKKDNALLS